MTSCGFLGTKPVVTEPPSTSVNSLKKLQTDIDVVLQDVLFETASIGIKVVSVETGEVIYEKNAHKLHHPASTTKLFTAAIALAKLGPDYQFTTSLYTDTTSDPELVGNVYLKGRADPVLQTEDLINMCNVLVQTGVKTIQGDIIVDETYLDAVREGPGWMWDDRPLRISALSIRDIEPNTHVGNRALTCGQLLKTTIMQKGIKVVGNVVTGTVAADVRRVATHRSPPISDIIKWMNKLSDNWIAEFLFKTIGAEVKGEPGSWAKGREAVTEFLSEIGGETPAHRFVDGSGLSRYNLINAELLTKLLVYMYHNFELMPEFMASLPIAGIDGTLKNRMHRMSAEKVLRAKTGTLSGVSALAGYTITEDEEVLAFGILVSHYVGSAGIARGIQDKIGDMLSQFSRKSINAN